MYSVAQKTAAIFRLLTFFKCLYQFARVLSAKISKISLLAYLLFFFRLAFYKFEQNGFLFLGHPACYE